MGEPIIEVDGLVKTFHGGVRALDGLSLRVPAGVTYGLLGPDGAGKTTLIRVLATLLPFEAGTAWVAGVDVGRDPAAVRARIGLAGQHAAVDDYLTGRENVEMVGLLYGLTRRETRRRTADVLDRIGLVEAADRPARTYSGGMRRRLDLAASLVGEPAVLFLDEPTTAVDPASRRGPVGADPPPRRQGHDGAVDHAVPGRGGSARRPDRGDRPRPARQRGHRRSLKDRVGAAVVELSVADADRARTMAAPTAAGADPRGGDSGAIVVPAPLGARSLHGVLRDLEAAGIAPERIGLRKPTLDEVFLTLTGRAAGTPVSSGKAA